MTTLRAWRWAIPAALILAVTTLWPLIAALWMSLFRSSATTASDTEFVALSNYGLLVTDSDFWDALATTLGLTAAVVVTQLVLGLLFAFALRELPITWPVARLVVLVPALTLSLASALAMQYAMESGFLATWLRLDGGDVWRSFLANYLAEVWRGTGFVVVILYIALMRLEPAVVENAMAVGAGGLRRLRSMWWPALKSAVAVAVVFRVLDTLRMLEGPVLRDGATVDKRTLSAQLWHDAFTGYEQGLAAATAVTLLAIVAVIGFGGARLLRGWRRP